MSLTQVIYIRNTGNYTTLQGPTKWLGLNKQKILTKYTSEGAYVGCIYHIQYGWCGNRKPQYSFAFMMTAVRHSYSYLAVTCSLSRVIHSSIVVYAVNIPKN